MNLDLRLAVGVFFMRHELDLIEISEVSGRVPLDAKTAGAIRVDAARETNTRPASRKEPSHPPGFRLT